MTLRAFLYTTFMHQNAYHRFSAIRHTFEVVRNVLKSDRSMIAAALLHDIGKPFTAVKHADDIGTPHYSFPAHEERSYQIIKNWPFVSERTKTLVRNHYLLARIERKKDACALATFNALSAEDKQALAVFRVADDAAK